METEKWALVSLPHFRVPLEIRLFLICHEVGSCRSATYPGALPAHKTLTLRVPARTGRSKYDAAARFASSIVSKLLRSKFERRRRGTSHAPRAPPSDQRAVGAGHLDHLAPAHQLLSMKKAKTRSFCVPARAVPQKVKCSLPGNRTHDPKTQSETMRLELPRPQHQRLKLPHWIPPPPSSLWVTVTHDI